MTCKLCCKLVVKLGEILIGRAEHLLMPRPDKVQKQLSSDMRLGIDVRGFVRNNKASSA